MIDVQKKFPEFHAANERLIELRADYARIDKEIDAKISAINDLAASGSTVKKTPIHSRALKLITGATDDSEVTRMPDLQDDLAKLRDEAEVTAEAIRIQEGICQKQKNKASSTIADEMRPAHVKATRRIAAALNELMEANAEERAIRDDIETAGMFCFLTPHFFTKVGFPGEKDNRVMVYLKELYAAGYMKRSELPKVLADDLPKASKPVAEGKAVADSWS